MLALGTPAPDFSLPDVVTGQTVSLASFAPEAPLLVIFLCHHCPFVKHAKSELSTLGKDYAGRISILGISSNDPAVSSEDSPEGLARMVADWELTYPICYDESQATAKAYQAACTPDIYLFDAQRSLVYRGQLDDSRPGNGLPVTGSDLRAALNALLGVGAVPSVQKPSVGCNIKWRPQNAPPYA